MLWWCVGARQRLRWLVYDVCGFLGVLVWVWMRKSWGMLAVSVFLPTVEVVIFAHGGGGEYCAECDVTLPGGRRW